MIFKDDSKKVDSLEKSFRLLQRPLNLMRRVEQKESTSRYVLLINHFMASW